TSLRAANGVVSGEFSIRTHLLDGLGEAFNEACSHVAQCFNTAAKPVHEQGTHPVQGKHVVHLATTFFSSTFSCAWLHNAWVMLYSKAFAWISCSMLCGNSPAKPSMSRWCLSVLKLSSTHHQ
ncbi:MAG: hypothetical protein ABIX00_04940, partial [Polaromonas sp.]